MQSNASSSSKVFLAVMALSGFAVLANAALHATSGNQVRFLTFIAVTCLAARLKVKLPGLTGTMSVNLPFILVAVGEMSTTEAIAIACVSTMVQCLPNGSQKFNPVHMIFNFCNMALAVCATRFVFAQPALSSMVGSRALVIAFGGATFFVINTAPVAMIIALTEAKNAFKIWGNLFQLSFPYFVLSAAFAGVIMAVSKQVGWQVPLLVLPIMFGVFKSYKRYFESAVGTAPSPMTRAAAAS
jgi:hypothetical protein